MSLKHDILASVYQPLRIYNKLAQQLSKQSNNRLRVLTYHNIPWHDEVLFEKQLQWLRKSWEFIDPDMFVAMITGIEPVKKDSILLTFDDGFISNLRVAQRILNPMGVRALFFIVSEFADLTPSDDWRSFVASNFHLGFTPNQVPDSLQNMNWNDLKLLLESGHAIGGHTANHERLSQVLTEDLDSAIIKSADKLELKLGVKIEHFANTFGDVASFSSDALEVVRNRFKYIYTGLRGDNGNGVYPWAIRRDATSAFDSCNLVGSFLEGGGDRMYVNSLNKYESWGYQ